MAESFSDIIDQSSAKKLLESLTEATGIPASLIDRRGAVLIASGWQDVCALFHRKHPETARKCEESDRFFSCFLEDNTLPPEGYIRNNCKNGFVELGLPIVIGDRHVATLLFGRFLPDPCDLEFFREKADEYDFNPGDYLAEINKMPVFDEAMVDKLIGVYSGITELLANLCETHLEETRIKKELRQSEQKFRDLFNNSSDAIFIVGFSGNILEVNSVASDKLGYSRRELLGMHVEDLDDPEFFEAIRNRIKRFRKEGHFIFETIHRHKDGSKIPVEINARIIDFEHTPAILCTARDLQERHDALQALQQSETRFRTIVNSSPMGMFLYYLDPEERLIFTGSNPAADQILGIDTGRFIGKTIEEAFPNLAETEIPERFREICRSGESWHTEQVLYEDENVSGIFEVYGFRTTPRTMALYFLDITARKKAEQRLLESEEKYRLLFTSETDAIIIFESENYGIIETNDAAARMYGYTQEEFKNLNALDLSANPEYSRGKIEEIFRDKKHHLVQGVHRRRDGTTFPVEVSAGQFEWQGNSLQVVIIRDISERERVDRMKDDMLSSVSHEMRTPLTAILGFTELLLQEDIDPEKTNQFLQLSYREGERLRELIDDLLDLQRLRAGFVGNCYETVHVKALLQEIAALFSDVSRNHEIKVFCSNDIPDIVADGQKIHRALKNLLTNAIKYSPEGGLVILSAQREEDDMVAIGVEDQGIGIPSDAQDQLFERFYRVYHPEVRNIGGAGLGLALVKEIVSIHNGNVRVVSTPGKGSTFYIDLPISGPAELKRSN